MNPAEVRAEIEAELTWRRNELRFLSNIMLGLESADDQDRFRKALVVMLYSHFEGFCRAALTIYIRAVNRVGLEAAELAEELAASALAKAFDDLESARKSKIFQRPLPSDETIHRLARRADFVAEFPGLLARKPAEVPEDVIDVESNLKPVVLRKNLFRIGLAPGLFEAHDGAINQLLNRRNNVAHGTQRDGIKQGDFEALQRAVFDIMDALTNELWASLVGGKFRRTA